MTKLLVLLIFAALVLFEKAAFEDSDEGNVMAKKYEKYTYFLPLTRF